MYDVKYWLVVFLMAFAVGCGREKVKVEIKIGDDAPGFSLMNQDGKRESLDAILSRGKFVAIVFFRSADW